MAYRSKGSFVDRSRERSGERRMRKERKKEERSHSREREKARRTSRSRSRSRSTSSKRHRHEKREHFVSNESSDGNDLQKKTKELKKQKEFQKLNENPEERRRRRLEKKMKKHGKTKGLEAFGYSNESNPFGDSNLGDHFVWKKKLEKEVDVGLRETATLTKEEIRKKRHEIRSEVEKVKQRRAEREREREEMERQRMLEQRAKEAAEYGDWEKKEEEFHLKQNKVRSHIRIQEGRERPIDVLAKNVLVFQSGQEEGVSFDDIEMELREPYRIFDGLTLSELAELKSDILNYAELEDKTSRNYEFWKLLHVISEDEIEKVTEKTQSYGRNIRSEIKQEIESLLQHKSYNQLVEMEKQAKDRVLTASTSGGIDVEYWEALLKDIKIYKSKARLKDIHAEMLLARLEQLEKKRQTIKTEESRDHQSEMAAKQAELEALERELRIEEQRAVHVNEQETKKKQNLKQIPAIITDSFVQCPPSPQMLPLSLLMEEDEMNWRNSVIPVVDEKEDRDRLSVTRLEVLEDKIRTFQLDPENDIQSKSVDSLLQKESKRQMEEDEELFQSEIVLAPKSMSWQDKYRPRKPRYFNRVKTGYDWNKYNQMHYDHSNPPPKTVQGYKFNIFFPDLIDKTKTPKFFLEPGDTTDTCILRFHAGPPYEDIAFKIVNREWEYARRHGFKCVFEGGVLQLWFNFKRFRYKR